MLVSMIGQVRARLSSLLPEQCALIITLSRSQNGLSPGSGSLRNTSSPAPAMRLFTSASSSAASSHTAPRARLMRNALFFMAASTPASMMFSVSRAWGASTTRKSASAAACLSSS